MTKKLKLIKKSDYSRVLITESLPFDTPLIFSNDGFHNHSKSKGKNIYQVLLDGFIFGTLLHRPYNSAIPFQYKIRKSETSLRRLALLHPVSQWKIKKFYEKYEKLILHYCSISPASIRSPNKTASSFYSKTSWENLYKYKTGSVSVSSTDRYTKHSPSFFSYRGYDRLYKFYESKDYLKLEKKFTNFWSLDVSKCFDSIYTHCLSWAIKDKRFTKQYVSIDSTFAQEFDALMRHCNHNETNGIPIGPEVSRIFSEIIFQSVESHVINQLKLRDKLEFDKDYAIRRYVDDIFIFGQSDLQVRNIHEIYSDELIKFNLHLNTNKTLKLTRPFITKKSRITKEVSSALNNFMGILCVDNGPHSLLPNKVNRPWQFTKFFIDSVKTIISYNEATYDDVAVFLIPALNERIKKLVNNEPDINDAVLHEKFKNAFVILLEIMFFLYGVSPSVSTSYKLSTSMILSKRFFEQQIPMFEETIRQKIYELTEELLSSQFVLRASKAQGFISLESVNIILASSELGQKYLLSEKIIEQIFILDGVCNYYDVVSCLYYVKDNSKYKIIKKQIVKIADNLLHDFSDIFHNSEKAYLFLDLLSCPYIHRPMKKMWLSKLYNQAVTPLASIASPSKLEVDDFLNTAGQKEWFISWSEIDLLNSLERKELNAAY